MMLDCKLGIKPELKFLMSYDNLWRARPVIIGSYQRAIFLAGLQNLYERSRYLFFFSELREFLILLFTHLAFLVVLENLLVLKISQLPAKPKISTQY